MASHNTSSTSNTNLELNGRQEIAEYIIAGYNALNPSANLDPADYGVGEGDSVTITFHQNGGLGVDYTVGENDDLRLAQIDNE